jgi:hypothetical protein
MAQNNKRTIRVAVVIQKEDRHGSVASTHCTEQEIKNLSIKDFVDRIVAPIAAHARNEFFQQSEKRARMSAP